MNAGQMVNKQFFRQENPMPRIHQRPERNMPDCINMGKRLRFLRKTQRMSVEGFCQILGVSEDSLRKYEAGSRQPPIDIIAFYCEYFSISADYIIFGKRVCFLVSELNETCTV